MQYAFRMCRSQARAELSGNIECFVLWQSSDTTQKGSEVLSVDVLHGEEGLTINVAHVIHTANIGMGNLAGKANFIAETLEQPLVVPCSVWQKLQCNRLSQRQIIGAVDFTHTALAEQVDDAVAACEHTSRQEHAVAEPECHRALRTNSRSRTLLRRSRRRGSEVEGSHFVAGRHRRSARRAKSGLIRDVRLACRAAGHKFPASVYRVTLKM